MAFDIQAVNKYGTGALGAVTFSSGQVNSYARVTAMTSSTITIGTASNGIYEKFAAGTEIMIHVSASTDAKKFAYLGNWLIAKIQSVSGSVLTIDKDPTSILPTANFAEYYVQAVTVAQFESLTLNTGTVITPPVYSVSNYYGGIVALKCTGALTLNGGSINLADKGIPVSDTNAAKLRPTTTQETAANGVTDVKKYAGWENHITVRNFFLNAGDGAAWIVTNKLNVANTASRIGNPATYGSQFFRGATDSVGDKVDGVTNLGGSTILLAAGSITNFDPKIIAKYRTPSGTGRGLCRCYIASETKLRNDEGLYAYDVISDPARLMRNCHIKDFGTGTLGDFTATAATVFNCYAKVTKLSADRKTLTYTGKTTNGQGTINVGSLVMVHANHKASTNCKDSGKFVLARVLSDNGTEIKIDFPAPNLNTSHYNFQIIGVPEYNNLTLAVTHTGTVAWANGVGGLTAVAVKDTFNLQGGGINGGTGTTKDNWRYAKGYFGAGYGRAGLAEIGNAQDSDKLPIGQGFGSIFILANKLQMNEKTRLGSTISGAGFGGSGNGGYLGSKGKTKGCRGSGAGVYDLPTNYLDAGYGSYGKHKYNTILLTTAEVKARTIGGVQGAHLMIVADTIEGFVIDAIATGGEGGSAGAGYGGGAGGGMTQYGKPAGGGYNGGGSGYYYYTNLVFYSGGGSSGWAFIYCNNASNADTTGTVLT